MHARVLSATPRGITADAIEVEATLMPGLAHWSLVGLADTAVKESKERIRAALVNSGLTVPAQAIVINLAPAQLKKVDVVCDLPIAIALLLVSKQLTLSIEYLATTLFLGELGLDGTLRPVHNMLTLAHFAQQRGIHRVIVPRGNGLEAALFPDLEVLEADSLQAVLHHITKSTLLTPVVTQVHGNSAIAPDVSTIVGQLHAKRALLIAAAGHHNMLLSGPPGCGKSMLASCLPGLLPPLSLEDQITTSKVYAARGLLSPGTLITYRPFRSPHHTISSVGLIGGGTRPQPGEVSLAHNGVLFLDEVTEFARATLEVLRQPLESHVAVITRAQQTVPFPACCICIAAMNPCPCGHAGNSQQQCTCSVRRVEQYQQKLSGPLLDRIDMRVTMHAISYSQLHTPVNGPNTAELAQHVSSVRALQQARKQLVPNGLLSSREVEQYCQLDSGAQHAVEQLFKKQGLSMRRYYKLRKLARTLADLTQSEYITASHIAEAYMYSKP